MWLLVAKPSSCDEFWQTLACRSLTVVPAPSCFSAAWKTWSKRWTRAMVVEPSPELQSGLQALGSDIHAAREAVKHDPPNYFLAGSVLVACLYCHKR